MSTQTKAPIAAKNTFLILFSQVIGLLVFIICLAIGMGGATGFMAILGIVILIASMIYPLVKLNQMSTEINIMCADDGEHLMPYICAWLLGFVTLGIYPLYYIYRMQTRLHENAHRYNVNISEKGGAVILWWLLGGLLFGIGMLVAFAIIIKSFNKMAYGYNASIKSSGKGKASVGAKAFIKCIKGDIAGASITLDATNDTIIIGRDPSMSNIVSSDKKISKQHCIIEFKANEQAFYVTDCNSTNGTKLSNGAKLIGGVQTKVSGNEQIILSENTVFVLDMPTDNGLTV